jgi:hypothetical protein
MPDFVKKRQKLMPTTTMNPSELSPCFFDAVEGGSPDQLSSTPTDHHAVDTPGTENSTPIGQGHLFPADADDRNPNVVSATFFSRLHNRLLVLDLDLVIEESLEEGQGEYTCFATDLEELNSSMQSATKECLEDGQRHQRHHWQFNKQLHSSSCQRFGAGSCSVPTTG